MSDSNNLKLPSNFLQSIADKNIDKKKAAILELQQIIKKETNDKNLQSLVDFIINECCLSKISLSRKGGYMCLSYTVVTLSKKSVQYIDTIIPCISIGMLDIDNQIRSEAIEAAYNFVKVIRNACYRFFNQLFEILLKNLTDHDNHIKSSSEILSKLLMDIVYETTNDFEFENFFKVLRQHIYSSSTTIKFFIVEWIKVLFEINPVIVCQLIHYVLDGLFVYFNDKSFELHKITENVIISVMHYLNNKMDQNSDHSLMLNIILLHVNSSNDYCKNICILWIESLVKNKPTFILNYSHVIYPSVLHSLATNLHNKESINIANLVENIQNLISNATSDSIKLDLIQVNWETLIPEIIQIISSGIESNNQLIKIFTIVLKSIKDFLKFVPKELILHKSILIENLFKILMDPKFNEFTKDSLEIIIQISIFQYTTSKSLSDTIVEEENPHFICCKQLFCGSNSNLINAFFWKNIETLFKQLIVLLELNNHLKNQHVYNILSDLSTVIGDWDMIHCLCHFTDIISDINVRQKFIRLFVHLITHDESSKFIRTSLIKVSDNKNCANSLLTCIVKYLICCPISTIQLFLLAQRYCCAYHIVNQLFKYDLNVDVLIQIDRLIESIESPSFTFLRFQLTKNTHVDLLYKILTGILMILPQSSSYNILNKRLKCIGPIFMRNGLIKTEDKFVEHECPFHSLIDKYSSNNQ